MAFYHIRHQRELSYLEELAHVDLVGLDLETAGVDPLEPRRCRIRLMQLATRWDCFVIDLDKVDPMAIVRPVLASSDVVTIAHNARFEARQLLHHFDLEPKNLFCTMLASQLLAKGHSMRHNLAEVSWRFLGLRIDKSLQASDWSGPLTEAQIQYAASDAEVLIDRYQAMEPMLRKEKLHKISQLEFRTIVPVAAMELRGIYVDPERLEKVRVKFSEECRQAEAAVLAELRSKDALPGMNLLNLNAPDEVRQALADRGIQVPDTSDARMRPLIAEYPFIAQLLEFRHKSRIVGGTLKSLKEAILPESGRVHSTYHQIASASGRFACSDPNIQQVPREAEVRGCIRPEQGYRYIVADYSQVELRVAAGMSKDPLMLEAYGKGQDLHRLTAALTKGLPVEEITRDERQAAKAINFGLIYAMGARGLQQSAKSSYGVELSLAEATVFRERFFQNYYGIRHWQREMEHRVRQNFYVRTGAGRIRSYEGDQIRLTELLNIPVQGTAAEGLKSALCIFWDRTREQGLDASVVAIIHDEIIVEVKDDQVEQARDLLVDSMIKGISWLVPGVPFEVDAVIADSWAVK